MQIREERLEKFKETIEKRQGDLTVILENVHDVHNIGAVLRTCDSVGITEIYILYTEPEIDLKNIRIGRRSSSGADKWVKIHYFTDVISCFEAVRKKYDKIYSTYLSEDAYSLYELKLTESVALLFGNEHQGLSQEALSYSDANFVIPQMGMVKSLNISVACAVSLYEALRQRDLIGNYDQENSSMSKEQRASLLEEYKETQREKKSKLPPPIRF